MKANEVPEKIILSVDRETGILYDEWVIKDLTDNIKIEYTRTDVFIEKACAFLKDRIVHDSIDYPMATVHLIDDFKNYMKGE